MWTRITYHVDIRKNIFLQKINSHNRIYWLRGRNDHCHFTFLISKILLSSCFVQKFLYFPTVWDMGGAGSISLYVAGFTSSCRRHGCAFCRDKCFRKTWLDDRRKRPGNKAGAKGGTKTSPIHLVAIAVIVFIVIASIISFSSLFLSSSQWHTFLITFKSVVFLYWSWHQCKFCMMINIYNKYNCMPH